MNKTVLIIFIIFTILFLISSFFWERLSLKDIFKSYIENYKGGFYYNKKGENKRKWSINGIIVLGIFPYILGILFFFSFKKIIANFNIDFLSQINIIFLTILCLFYGFNINDKENNKELFNETNAIILISILLIIINSFIQLFIYSSKNVPLTFNILNCCFWAIEFKILIAFFYIVRRINFFKSKNL